MNMKKIFAQRKLIFILSRNLFKAKSLLPLEVEPGTYPHLKKQCPLDGLKSWEERIKEINDVKFEKELEPVNIGYSIPKVVLELKQQHNPELEYLARKRKLVIDTDKFFQETKNIKESIMSNYNIASFYNIYKDLFHSPHFFYPIKHIDLEYDYTEDDVMPIYSGNLISPSLTKSEPAFSFESDTDSLWTLVMSCPDEHLEFNDKEYVHWIVSNISMKENIPVSMDCVVPYIQPIPYFGTGFHRYVFVLYKQDAGKVDLSRHCLSKDCLLEDRTFSSYEFLKRNQDVLTPVGLAFFQSCWDLSVRECFRNTLNCLEPMFEYNWPKEKLKPMEQFPEGKEMYRYFDNYRDVKDLREEVLKERLKRVDPYREIKRLEFPLGIPDDPNEIGFVKERFKDKELRKNQWKEMDIVDDIF